MLRSAKILGTAEQKISFKCKIPLKEEYEVKKTIKNILTQADLSTKFLI